MAASYVLVASTRALHPMLAERRELGPATRIVL